MRCVNAASCYRCMSPAHNGNSDVSRFEGSDTIEIRIGIMFVSTQEDIV